MKEIQDSSGWQEVECHAELVSASVCLQNLLNILKADSSLFGSEWQILFIVILSVAKYLYCETNQWQFRMTFCCHPEFISESYYSQKSVKYCRNRFFGRCPQNDKKWFSHTERSEVSFQWVMPPTCNFISLSSWFGIDSSGDALRMTEHDPIFE